jgi:hypothetical protein
VHHVEARGENARHAADSVSSVANRQSAGRGYDRSAAIWPERAAWESAGSFRPWRSRQTRSTVRSLTKEGQAVATGPATGTTRRLTSWSRASASRSRPARMARPLPLSAGVSGATNNRRDRVFTRSGSLVGATDLEVGQPQHWYLMWRAVMPRPSESSSPTVPGDDGTSGALGTARLTHDASSRPRLPLTLLPLECQDACTSSSVDRRSPALGSAFRQVRDNVRK